MQLYTIYARGKAIGTEFGASAEDAVRRYAEGSTYAADQLKAVRGHRAA